MKKLPRNVLKFFINFGQKKRKIQAQEQIRGSRLAQIVDYALEDFDLLSDFQLRSHYVGSEDVLGVGDEGFFEPFNCGFFVDEA